MAIDVRGSRGTLGLYVLLATAVTTAILGVLAHYLHEPFVFPSVGPTIFILFFTPLGLQAAPRNVIGGQVIGIACGYLALMVFGLTGGPADIFDLTEDLVTREVTAAILAGDLEGALIDDVRKAVVAKTVKTARFAAIAVDLQDKLQDPLAVRS